MRILVAGLGDIARKAYLPVLTAMPGLDLHFATRDRAMLEACGRRYRVPNLHGGVAEALAAARFDLAFVHAATAAHPVLVDTLLRAGVNVFVDKPLADTLEQTERLLDLAGRERRLLRVGFNRRFAPDHVALRAAPRPFVMIQKHRHASPDHPRRVVFDDFIHVIDTLLFLAPEASPRVTIETRMQDGLLHGATLMLGGAEHHAVGTMQRDSGLDEERVEVIGAGRRRAVLNLSERIEQDGADHRTRRGDWTPVGRQRGFEAMCADVIDAVRDGRATPAREIWETHRLCEAVVRHAGAVAP